MFIDKEKYTAHIIDSDKQILMRQLLDKVASVLNNHDIQITDFLDPYERYLAKTILNRFDIGYSEFGCIEDAERKIIQVFPEYSDGCYMENYTKVLKLTGDLSNLSHKDFLGGLLNLGIKRCKVGDILLFDTYCALIVKKEISDFVILNLEKIGNKNMAIEEMSFKNLQIPQMKYKEISVLIASIRLDIIISTSYKLSRTESLNVIKSGKVKVNWEKIDKSSKELEEGDIISVRGYGRIILYSLEGMSKKGKLRATIRILI